MEEMDPQGLVHVVTQLHSGYEYDHWHYCKRNKQKLHVRVEEVCSACEIMERRDLQERVKQLEHEVEVLSDMVRNPAFAFEPIVRSILSRVASFVSRRL